MSYLYDDILASFIVRNRLPVVRLNVDWDVSCIYERNPNLSDENYPSNIVFMPLEEILKYVKKDDDEYIVEIVDVANWLAENYMCCVIDWQLTKRTQQVDENPSTKRAKISQD